MFWRLIESGKEDAYMNMAIDEAIASSVLEGASPPTLRFYGWKTPSITIGAFQRLSDINMDYCRDMGIPIVRRPTGGRAILHGNDLTYSFSSPNTAPFFSEGLLKSYSYISEAFLRGFREMGIPVQLKSRRERGRVLTGSALCFQSVSYGEITLNGKKLLGSAQKRWKRGFLQQGSLLLKTNSEEMQRVFNRATRDSILSTMTGLLDVYPEIDLKTLKEAIIKGFKEVFNAEFKYSSLTTDERSLAEKLCREKYARSEWLKYRV